MSYRYGSQGRYWNVGLSEPGRLAATARQLRALWYLSDRKVDYRSKGLTRDEASEEIRRLSEEREERQKHEDPGAMQHAMFRAAMRRAIRAANAAGDAWMAQHPEPLFRIYDPETQTFEPVHGVMGYAYLSWPPRRSPFGVWLRENHYEGQIVSVPVPHSYMDRRERDLQIACEAAALREFEKVGIVGIHLMVREDPSVLAEAS